MSYTYYFYLEGDRVVTPGVIWHGALTLAYEEGAIQLWHKRARSARGSMRGTIITDEAFYKIVRVARLAYTERNGATHFATEITELPAGPASLWRVRRHQAFALAKREAHNPPPREYVV